MLEHVHGNFEDNLMLEGILADLIIPADLTILAVRRKELGIQHRGQVAAIISEVQSAPAQLKAKLLQIMFDLMVVYEQQLWGRAESADARVFGVYDNAILIFLTDTLEAEKDAAVQAALCVGPAADPKIFKSLLLAYVSPHMAGDAPVRQSLAYFFPVYCYSAAANQACVCVETFETKAAHAGADRHTDVHAELAVDILLALYDSDRDSKDQEALCAIRARPRTPTDNDESWPAPTTSGLCIHVRVRALVIYLRGLHMVLPPPDGAQ
ncbi:hypothetical protein B0H17DRAFT_1214335 [Mycena rosella]|uniref:Nuclear condensin complex subunit 3 C-terminal domain-containing protein n=1 Tax=Mycena rosella TaxID=1033263 RepID=A0AAD7G0Y8_MYCRO|nr:hypothetical protein B0H17DRAFT_1214335 [Mycena rosella]